MSRHIAIFIMFVFGLFIFSIWTLVKFNDTYNMLTKHTQLSAWALAQLEIETLEFSSSLKPTCSTTPVRHANSISNTTFYGTVMIRFSTATKHARSVRSTVLVK